MGVQYNMYFSRNNNKRINNKLTRHQSLSVKKSNFSGAGPKREKPGPVSSGHRLGPEPKEVPKVLFSGKSNTVNIKEIDFVASTVVSPPPSSLPLPTFSIRPKLAANSPAVAVVDDGATNGLRRILHLPWIIIRVDIWMLQCCFCCHCMRMLCLGLCIWSCYGKDGIS